MSIRIEFSLPPDLIAELDQRKEKNFKDVSYEEMLSYFVNLGLRCVEEEKSKQGGKTSQSNMAGTSHAAPSSSGASHNEPDNHWNS